MKKKLLAILSLFALMLFFSGSACNHEWEPWTLGETEMTRVCSICYTEESAEIDREAYLLQQLQGHWDLYGKLDSEGQLIPAYYLYDGSSFFCCFNPDGTGEFCDGKKVTTSKCQYEGYSSEADQYLFSIILMPEGEEYMIVYSPVNNELFIPLPNDAYLVFDQNQGLAEQITGIWAISGDGRIHSLELHEDRTFAAELDEAFTGRWLLCAPVDYYNSGTYVGRLILEYEQNGAVAMQDFDISVPSDPEHESYNISCVREAGSRVFFSKSDATRLENQKAASQDANTHILGQWTSTCVTSYAEGTKNTPTQDYSITFAEDGTFTASLDQERAGTWSVDGVYDSSFTYKLHFDGVSEAVEATFSTAAYNDSKLWLSGPLNDTYYGVSFAQMNEEEKAAQAAAAEEANTLILGDWFSSSVNDWENDLSTVNTGYAISFSPDGTFTANLEEGTSGRWSVGPVSSYGGGVIGYFYNLEMDGTGKCFQAQLLNIEGRLYLSGEGRSISLGQYTEEDLKMIEEMSEEGPSRIVGTWTSSDGSLAVNPDGTYTSTLNWLPDGTWKFDGIDPEDGLQFHFLLSSGNGYVYNISPDGKLHCWLKDSSGSYGTVMTKE